MLDIELVLTLFANYLPAEDPALAWAVLNGHSSVTFENLNTDARRAIKLARLRLPDQISRGRWIRDLEQYRNMAGSSEYALYRLVGKQIIAEPTSILPQRSELMQKALQTAPNWKPRDSNYARAGNYRFYIDRIPQEVEIGERVAAVAQQFRPSRLSMNNKNDLRYKEPILIELDKLVEEARWMDQHAPAGSQAAQQWETRIRNLQLHLFEQNEGLTRSSRLTLDGLLHLIGMVGSGKSSLFTVLTVHLARQGKRVTIVQSDVASLLKEMQVFEGLSKADPKLLVVPMVGRSTRITHLNRLHVVEAQRHGPTLGLDHPAYPMLSTICPLDGLRRDVTEPIKPGFEPCNRLYPIENEAESPDNRRDCPVAASLSNSFTDPQVGRGHNLVGNAGQSPGERPTATSSGGRNSQHRTGDATL